MIKDLYSIASESLIGFMVALVLCAAIGAWFARGFFSRIKKVEATAAKNTEEIETACAKNKALIEDYAEEFTTKLQLTNSAIQDINTTLQSVSEQQRRREIYHEQLREVLVQQTEALSKQTEALHSLEKTVSFMRGTLEVPPQQ